MSGNKNILLLLLLGVSYLIVPSCGKEQSYSGASGIVFRPSSYGGAQTKTSYTDDGTFTGTAPNRVLTRERIDWVNNDLFTVVCAQAKVYDKSSTPWTLVFSHTSPDYSESDYRVQSHKTDTGDNTVSRASIVSVDENGLQWGSGEHTFYAMYPSANTAAFTTAEKAKVGISSSEFKGTIPAAQTPQWSNDGRPQMQYAYMFATATTAAEASEVKLPFYPHFTAFEFTVTSGENDAVALTSFSFSAVTAGTPVTGDFVLQNSAPFGVPVTSNTSSQITVNLSGKTVTPTAPLKFTVLGLPTAMGAMRMSFTGPEIGTRTVVLKQKNAQGQFEEIQFQARKKYRIRGIEFPKDDPTGGGEQIIWDQEAFGEDILWDNEYVLEGTIPASLETSHFGGTVTVATDFRSCQVDGSTASPEPFSFQYSATGADGSWTDGLPAWLSPDAGTDLGGAATATSLSLALSPLSTAGTPRSSYVRILQTNTGESTDACLITQDFLKFSVTPSKKVIFSHGNLVVENTFNGSANNRVWKFEDNQWDYSYGDANYSVNGTTKRISHFGWATAAVKNSGGDYAFDVNHKRFYPHQTQSSPQTTEDASLANTYRYGPSVSASSPYVWAGSLPFGDLEVKNSWNRLGLNTDENLVRKYCDWGVHFNDAGVGSNGTTTGTWETLSAYEWGYLLSASTTRAGASYLLGRGTIHVDADNKDVPGLIILPDNWVKPSACTFSPSVDGFTTNRYTTGGDASGYNGRWSEMEAFGAVFLPAAGCRAGEAGGKAESFYREGEYGYYWTSSASDLDSSGGYSYHLAFNTNSEVQSPTSRYGAACVRLVREK